MKTARASLGCSSSAARAAHEPGLQFVCRACDYYGVSADYLLGRTDQPTLPAEQLERLRLAVRAMQSTAEQAAHALSSLTGDSEP